MAVTPSAASASTFAAAPANVPRRDVGTDGSFIVSPRTWTS